MDAADEPTRMYLRRVLKVKYAASVYKIFMLVYLSFSAAGI